MSTRATQPVWRPTKMLAELALSAQLVLMVIAMVRGADYGSGESPTASHRLGAVESAAPLWAWGLVFTACAAAGLVSIAWRFAAGIISAHTALCALYAAIGVGIVIDATARVTDTGGALSPVLLIPTAALIAAAIRASQRGGVTIGVAVAAAIALTMALTSIPLDGLRNASILFGVAALHGVLAVGTAQVATQARIRHDRKEATCE